MIADLSFVRLLINVLFLSTWSLAAFGKFSSRDVPEWFLKQFESSFIVRFPGTKIAYWSIGCAETLAAILCLISLVKLEFFTTTEPFFLKYAIICSMMIFAMLGFGLRLVSDFAGAASSFQYFTGTLVCYAFLELVPKPF